MAVVRIVANVASFLLRPAGFGETIAAPQRQAAAAEPLRRFQDCAVIAGALELVGCGEAGDAGAENDHAAAVAGLSRQRQARGLGGRRHVGSPLSPAIDL